MTLKKRKLSKTLLEKEKMLLTNLFFPFPTTFSSPCKLEIIVSIFFCLSTHAFALIFTPSSLNGFPVWNQYLTTAWVLQVSINDELFYTGSKPAGAFCISAMHLLPTFMYVRWMLVCDWPSRHFLS